MLRDGQWKTFIWQAAFKEDQGGDPPMGRGGLRCDLCYLEPFVVAAGGGCPLA